MSKTTEIDAVLAEARTRGLNASVDRGGKHYKVRLHDIARNRTVALVVAKSGSDYRGIKNSVARVRRFADGRDV